MTTCWNSLLHLLLFVKRSITARFRPYLHAWELMSRPATDRFGAAGRLQSAWFETNDLDLNNALLVSSDDWVDAGSRESRPGPLLLGLFATILEYLGCVGRC